MTGPLLVFTTVVIVALLAFYVASRYRVANANEALVVAGSRGSKVRDEKGQALTPAGDKGVKVVVGGGTFVLPLIHRVGKLKLTARQINVSLSDAVTSQGIKVQVQGVATFKIGRDVESLRNAAERFLEAKDEQVDSIVKNVLEGSLRSIVGTLTIEELIMDRQKLQQAVQDAAKGDLATSGLQIDAFTIQSISDESNYIELLGQQKLALVERDARMAKATADQEAAVREAEAEQVKINAQRDVSLRRADTQVQVAAAEARAGQSGPLAQAEAQQEVVRKQTELAQLEANRKEKELLSTTIKPAEADAEAMIQRAEGDKRAKIAGAEAEAERVRLSGGAEATVVLTKGEAEAKALAMRADAYKQFNEAAVIQTVLTALPDIVRAASEPMGHIDTMTVMSTDGATEVVRNATRAVVESATAIKGLTGIDVPSLVGTAMAGGFKQKDGGSPATAEAALDALNSVETVAAEVKERAGRVGARAHEEATAGERTVEEAGGKAVEQAGQVEKQAAEATASALEEAGAVGARVEQSAQAAERSTPADWARWLALELSRVPGIDAYANTKLTELTRIGPRPARALWRTATAVLEKEYGPVTIGDLIKRFSATPRS
jgi:flotillin